MGSSWKNDLRFTGRVHLYDVQLGSSGLIDSVLNLINVRERVLDIGTREVTFVCQNGRIQASPIILNVKGEEIVLIGSLGLDQSIDYQAVVPMTRALVGKEVARYLIWRACV